MTTIEEWDKWFAATIDEESRKTWNAAKSVHDDPATLNTWAIIIEMNRIDRAIKETAPHSTSPQGVVYDQETGA